MPSRVQLKLIEQLLNLPTVKVIDCIKHRRKPFSEDLDFIKRRRGYTKRLATQDELQVQKLAQEIDGIQ